MLSFFAAVSAPLRIRSQNVSPGGPWVTIATVNRGVSAWPAPIPSPVVRGLPPVLEQAVSAAKIPMDAAITRKVFIVAPSADGRRVRGLERVSGDLQSF